MGFVQNNLINFTWITFSKTPY